MLALKITGLVLLILSYIIMMSIMIIFERDKPKNIILWSIIFLFTSIIGYIIYIISRTIFCKKKRSLKIKQEEDSIYLNLINKEIFKNDLKTNDDLYVFNNMAYNAKLTSNNNFELINSYDKFKDNLIKELQSAEKYIIFEVVYVNAKDFDRIKSILISKAKVNVNVKFIYDSIISPKLKRELRKSGVKVYRFSKHNTIGKVYSNKRNFIIIDGKVSFMCNLNVKSRELSGKIDVANTIIKFKGDVVQELDITAHQDVVSASGKYFDYIAPPKEAYANECKIQYIANEIETDIELLLIKAICMAKKSIQLQLEEFIPTESIMSLLRFAINSNIDVRLMVPLKTNMHSKYYASRAYAKELALFGANVYLYDGFIKFNAITIDSKYVIFGSFILDREHISTALQNAVVIEDERAVNYFTKTFDEDIENSYRISNAKLMLLREKFFKNFV